MFIFPGEKEEIESLINGWTETEIVEGKISESDGRRARRRLVAILCSELGFKNDSDLNIHSIGGEEFILKMTFFAYHRLES